MGTDGKEEREKEIPKALTVSSDMDESTRTFSFRLFPVFTKYFKCG